MSSLLKEFARGDVQTDLKNSDGSDAGKSDTSVNSKADIGFSLMRNMINKSGDGVTGSDVNDYLERAHDLNDEVESVGFALEDDSGEIIKVYVNAQDADAFEEQMAKLLGLDDDIEAAINQLAQKYDIIDVIWPEPLTDDSENVDDQDLSIDSSVADFSMDGDDEELDDALPADDEVKPKGSDSLMRDIEAAAAADETPPEDTTPPENDDTNGDDTNGDDTNGDDTEEEPEGEEELEPVLNDDGSQKLDKDGNPVMRKKRKTEPAMGEGLLRSVAEGAGDEINSHVAAVMAKGNKGQFFIKTTVTGGVGGRRSHPVTKDGKIAFFKDQGLAQAEADRLKRLKNAAGAKASYKYDVKVVEDQHNVDIGENTHHVAKENFDMDTIGSKFLNRIMEAEDRDGIKDGLNIPLDSQQRMLVGRLKRPVEKRIVGLFAMAGVMGRLLVSHDAEDSIRAGAEVLRNNRSARMAFDAFYSALAKAKGYSSTVAEQISEATLNEVKLKRGSFLQKKFETILIMLGLPPDLIATDGPGVIAPAMFKTTKIIDADSGLQAAMNRLAIRLGITSSETSAPAVEESKEVTEAIDVGNDAFLDGIVALSLALGIPEANLNYQRANLVRSLRARKQSLENRGMIAQRMTVLAQLLQKSTRAPAQTAATQAAVKPGATPGEVAESLLAEGLLLEAFGDLEAITGNELEKYNIIEPNAGPAMEASYDGGGNHEDTKLVIGVDPEHDDLKNLSVEIASPWDGVIHRKNFTNDKTGYKAALDYANMLRTANLKSGGRPRGWKDEAPTK